MFSIFIKNKNRCIKTKIELLCININIVKKDLKSK